MVKEVITKFFDAAMTDKVLAEKLAALAEENGYNFTAAELLEVSAIQPITDEEMEIAAGGGKETLMETRIWCGKCKSSWMKRSLEPIPTPTKCSMCGSGRLRIQIIRY